MKRTLYPHQATALDNLRTSLKTGHRRPMLQAPTGFGKTVLAAEIIECALAKGNPVIFTVPAVSLIDQTYSAFFQAGIYDLGVLQGRHPQTRPGAAVQIASVQTLARRKIQTATLVIVDEAHRWFDFYGDWMNRPEWLKTPFVGLSATPWTRGLGKHYDDLVIAETTQGLIDKGFLAPFRAYAPAAGLKPDLDGIRTVAGDYHEGMLSAEMSRAPLVADAVRTWLEKGEGRPTIAFAVDRKHARALHAQFDRAGVPAEYVDAFTSRDERSAIGRRLGSGQTKVVVNIGCLTTGIDWPFVSCIILARPTKSEILYTQIVGRGLRTDDGKADLVLLDHSDSTRRLGFVTDIHHSALDGGDLKRSKSSRAEKEEQEKPKPEECLNCGRIKPAAVRKCPSCGFMTVPQTKHVHIEGELEQVCGKAIKADKTCKQRWYSMLLHIADERGYKPGWAANKYREKFGVWPRGLSEIRRSPDAEVRNFVLSRQIAWAKSSRRAA